MYNVFNLHCAMYIVENDNPILHSTDTYMEREELNKFCKEEGAVFTYKEFGQGLMYT